MDRREQELREKTDLLNMVASHISGVVFRLVVNPDGFFGFTYISNQSMEILGTGNNPANFSELLTANIFHDDREQFLNSIQNSISNNTVWNFKGRYIKPSGEMIRLKIISSRNAENDTVIFHGIITDDSLM